MKMLGKNIYIRIAAIITAVFMALILPGEMVFAAPVSMAKIDMSQKGSLTVTHLSVDEEQMGNVPSHIYLVATIDDNGQYTITDQFRGFFSDSDCFNNGYNYDAWKNYVAYDTASDSDNLLAYIQENNISPVAEKLSDANGKTYYTDLTLGVYYVLSDRVNAGGYTHSFVNFLYPVPILEMTSSGKININYNPSVSPKKSKVGNVHCNIRKRWSDSGNTENRPTSVTFRIYCDGEFMEDVTLSSENDWFYEWEKEGDHTFSVEEIDVPAGYSSNMDIVQDGHHFQFVFTNNYNPPSTPPDTPDTPGTPDTPDTPGTPDTPSTPGIPDLPEVLGAIRDLPQVLGARRLPQTGQLWWPLPILVIAGVFMIVKGIKKNSKNA